MCRTEKTSEAEESKCQGTEVRRRTVQKQKEDHCGWKVAAARGRVVGDDKRGQESDPGGCCGAR